MAYFTSADSYVAVLAPSGNLDNPSAPVTTNQVGQCVAHRIRINVDQLETTQEGDGSRKFTSGLISGEGSLTLNFDPTTAVNHDELMTLLLSAVGGTLPSGGDVSLFLYTDNTAAGGSKKAYGMTVRGTSADIATPPGGLTTCEFSFVVNGMIESDVAGA